MTNTHDTYDIAFWTCPRCSWPEPRSGHRIVTSTADWPMCGYCGDYAISGGDGRTLWDAMARLVHSESCDCNEYAGRIVHHNGGRYHTATWELTEIGPHVP
jgi:hypothetical protein